MKQDVQGNQVFCQSKEYKEKGELIVNQSYKKRVEEKKH